MVRRDVLFQVRHGFYGAYLVVASLYALLLAFLPGEYRGAGVVLILFIDTTALGFFFLGGLVLLEKGQRIYQGLFSSPLRIGEFLAARVISLTFLSGAMSTLIVAAGRSLPAAPGLLAAGVVLSSAFFTLAGFPFAARCRNVNSYFITAMGVLSPLFIPLLPFLRIMELPRIAGLLPTAAALNLLAGAYRGIAVEDAAGSILILVFWIGIAAAAAYRWFYRYIAHTLGGDV